MYDLTITHTAADGTLIDGTSKGDGTAAILKAHRWRWFRSLGMWGISHSRDRQPDYSRIRATAAALREAGFTVAIDINDEARPTAEVEADKLARQADRVAALEAKAQRATDQAHHASQTAHELGHRIPLGQPAINDRMRRTYKKLHRLNDKARSTHEAAQAAENKAAAARTTTCQRYAPVMVANRIQKLEADIRRTEREIRAPYLDENGYRPATNAMIKARTKHYAPQLDGLRDQLRYWQNVREDQIANGTATNYGPDTVKKGDAVKIRGHWYRVARANPKTVSVETEYSWTDRSPWHEVSDHRPAGE